MIDGTPVVLVVGVNQNKSSTIGLSVGFPGKHFRLDLPCNGGPWLRIKILPLLTCRTKAAIDFIRVFKLPVICRIVLIYLPTFRVEAFFQDFIFVPCVLVSLGCLLSVSEFGSGTIHRPRMYRLMNTLLTAVMPGLILSPTCQALENLATLGVVALESAFESSPFSMNEDSHNPLKSFIFTYPHIFIGPK